MAYNAIEIANWFIRRAKEDESRKGKEDEFLSVNAVIKLVYIAHGWHLAIYDRPLYLNGTEVWHHGPVVPEIYEAFREQGVRVKETVDIESGSEIKKEDINLLEQIYNIYGDFKPWHLSNLTHDKGGPWDVAYKAGGRFAPIPDALIKEHYDQKHVEFETENG